MPHVVAPVFPKRTEKGGIAVHPKSAAPHVGLKLSGCCQRIGVVSLNLLLANKLVGGPPLPGLSFYLCEPCSKFTTACENR